jgi:hypothetical protein
MKSNLCQHLVIIGLDAVAVDLDGQAAVFYGH